MVISTETICGSEQGYMCFSSLKYTYNSVFSPNSHPVSAKKSTIKLAWICTFLHRKNLSTLSCKSNYIKLHKLHKIESLLTKDYKVLFTTIKGREQSNIWCCCTVQEKDLLTSVKTKRLQNKFTCQRYEGQLQKHFKNTNEKQFSCDCKMCYNNMCIVSLLIYT